MVPLWTWPSELEGHLLSLIFVLLKVVLSYSVLWWAGSMFQEIQLREVELWEKSPSGIAPPVHGIALGHTRRGSKGVWPHSTRGGFVSSVLSLWCSWPPSSAMLGILTMHRHFSSFLHSFNQRVWSPYNTGCPQQWLTQAMILGVYILQGRELMNSVHN